MTDAPTFAVTASDVARRQPVGPQSLWVPAQDFARHARHLVEETGAPWRVIAILSGVSSRTVARLLGHGRPMTRIRRVDAIRLLTLGPDEVDRTHRHLVDATSTRHRVDALLRAGHTRRQVARYLDVSCHEVGEIGSGRRRQCTQMVRLRARAACERHRVIPDVPRRTCGPTVLDEAA